MHSASLAHLPFSRRCCCLCCALVCLFALRSGPRDSVLSLLACYSLLFDLLLGFAMFDAMRSWISPISLRVVCVFRSVHLQPGTVKHVLQPRLVPDRRRMHLQRGALYPPSCFKLVTFCN